MNEPIVISRGKFTAYITQEDAEVCTVRIAPPVILFPAFKDCYEGESVGFQPLVVTPNMAAFEARHACVSAEWKPGVVMAIVERLVTSLLEGLNDLDPA